jgi:putative membrane protein
MTAVALILAGLAAALHVFIWTMESITWKQPATWKRFGLESQADAETTSSLAYNQGYYNLFLAIGTIVGIVLVVMYDDPPCNTVGWTLIISACASMVAASLVLISTGISFARAAATQGTIPALAVIAAIIALS